METALRVLAWTSVLGLGAIMAAYVVGSLFGTS
jgi:VIT1/CCC1 family predicted Fe2+/Mn2+ transporter